VRPTAWAKFRRFLLTWLFHFFGGHSFGDWLKLLCRQRFAVDPPYWPRAALITANSLANSLHRRREDRLCGAAAAAQTVRPPLFILGHWRTGTTHLHNLLTVDQRFAFPNNYQVCYPSTFLTTEAAAASFGFMLPDTRLQDNVRLTLPDPQEDEIALCIVTGLSLYMGWAFPRRAAYYDRYLTFRGVPPGEVERWKEALVFFLKKLTLKYGRPLLLKSPPHTCRVRLLLELFPDARFVHIHRDPFTVFRSTRHMIRTAIPALRLQVSEDRRLDEWILRTYRTMYDAFFEERGLIPPGRYHEVCFEELEKDPVGQLRQVYRGLNLDGFDAVEPPLRRYLDSLAGYRKNEYAALPPELRCRIADEWRRCFAEWGYPVRSVPSVP
jgi:hypothetical protein